MIVSQPIYRKPKFWWWLLGGVTVLALFLLFREEINRVWELLSAFLLVPLGVVEAIPLDSTHLSAVVVLALNVLGGWGLFSLGLLLVSQFILPVQTLEERRKVGDRLRLYIRGKHGPAIFVSEGKQIARQEELKRTGPGVALVDLCSAIVLEREGASPPLHAPPPKPRRGLFAALKRPSKKKKPVLPVRVAGPGVVFTEKGEKIRGVVDLRRQFRISDEKLALTRDGIEVKTKVIAIFTLGQPPDVLKITTDLKIIQLGDKTIQSEIGDSRPLLLESGASTSGSRLVERKVQIIRDLTDDLDKENKSEVENFLRTYNPQEPPPAPAPAGKPGKRKTRAKPASPYLFDEQRVFAAVYARARHTLDDNVDEWTDLPLQVAHETLRNKLSEVEYDYLYQPDDPKQYPMKDFKSAFGSKVRQQGVMAFQIVQRSDGQPIKPGDEWREENYTISPVQTFKNSKDLRDRGIKILVASFTGLEPVNENVRKRIQETWRARWQQETAKTQADYDLQAIQVRDRARAQAQVDMTNTLSQIFQMSRHSKEALAWRLFQAVERAATDPATRQLLPGDTIRLLSAMHEWLFPEAEKPGQEPIEGSAQEAEGGV